MTRPLIIISLLVAVIAAIFVFAHIGGGDVGVWLVLGAIILTDVGILTGQ